MLNRSFGCAKKKCLSLGKRVDLFYGGGAYPKILQDEVRVSPDLAKALFEREREQ